MHFKLNSHMMGSPTDQCSADGMNLVLMGHLDAKIMFWSYVKITATQANQILYPCANKAKYRK